MRIVLTETKDLADERLVVFKCDDGHGLAHWLSNVPIVESEYEVEIDCDEVLKFGVNVRASDKVSYSISSYDGNTTFVAKTEDIYDDGMVALRFGDAILVAEFEGNPPVRGSWIEVTTNQLGLNNVSH